MTLTLYDTLTAKKQAFEPLDRTHVRMYVCGPTVYDFAHIGNARPVIVFDVLFRLLRHLYGKEHVTYVRNITDVDDKINARAAEEYPDFPLNEAIRRVTERTEKQFHEDVKALHCLEPSVEPRATEHIDEMKVLIDRLVEANHAYVEREHVLFHVSSMTDYGKLSKRSLDEMIAGARIEIAPFKRDPMDFVLWKPSKPGEPAWPSPCGINTAGRPGWHLECSAMAWKHLGKIFDIHGGGIDLVFPHHENEIAQSRCAFHTPAMANVWMHNGFLQVEGAKMSKSLGNFVTINELLHTVTFGGQSWSGLAIRLAMLRTHYHQPIDWTVENLRRAEETLERWLAFAGERTTKTPEKQSFARFMGYLNDDLNTPGALGVIDEVVAETPTPSRRYFVYKGLNLLGFKVPLSPTKRISNAVTRVLKDLERLPDSYLKALVGKASSNPRYNSGKYRPEASLTLGLSLLERLAVSRGVISSVNERDVVDYSQKIGVRNAYKISKLIDARAAARAAKNFSEADRIREELAAMGVVLKDSKDGTTWEIAP